MWIVWIDEGDEFVTGVTPDFFLSLISRPVSHVEYKRIVYRNTFLFLSLDISLSKCQSDLSRDIFQLFGLFETPPTLHIYMNA